jgi:putative acetyltransferase
VSDGVDMRIRPGTAADHPALLDLWLRSVRATHAFLTEDDIQFYLPIVRDMALPTLELWVLETGGGEPMGFMGLIGHKLEALFVDPALLRRGGGRRLVEHARKLKGELLVDVNEQNTAACRFYEACGFVLEGRSPLDSTGRPFPLRHMRLPAESRR